MYMGAIVQGLLVQQPGQQRHAAQAEGERDDQGQAGVDAEDGEESDEDADGEREGDPVRACPRCWRRAARICGRRLTRRAAAGARSLKCSCEAATATVDARPQADRGLARRELAHHGEGQVPDHGEVPQRVQAVRGDRQQELIVLATVEGQGQGVAAAGPLEAGRRARSTGTAKASIGGLDTARLAEPTEVARKAVREVDGRVHQLDLGEGAGEGQRRLRDRAAHAGSAAGRRPTIRSRRPVLHELAVVVEARALGEELEARRGGAQRAGDHRQVARPRAAATHDPRRPARAGSARPRRAPRCAARLPPTTFTPVSAARSSRPS